MLTIPLTVPLEAVSPILSTDERWEGLIDRFWASYDRVFKEPFETSKCGSHIHVSPAPNQHFSLVELKRIACGIAFYKGYLRHLIPGVRLRSKYCQYNDISDDDLLKIWSCPSKEALVNLVQSDRRVLWNFANVVGDNCTGTVEFRGGACLMNSKGTKAWVAFAVSFIQLCISSKVRHTPVSTQRAKPNDDY